MSDHQHSEAFILSSSCPSSCSLVSFALRLGGILDPDFLLHCQVTDKKLQEKIDELKQIPLNYETVGSNYDCQEEIFLDMDASQSRKFFDSWEFKQYNAWLANRNVWDIDCSPHKDLIIDFI